MGSYLVGPYVVLGEEATTPVASIFLEALSSAGIQGAVWKDGILGSAFHPTAIPFSYAVGFGSVVVAAVMYHERLPDWFRGVLILNEGEDVDAFQLKTGMPCATPDGLIAKLLAATEDVAGVLLSAGGPFEEVDAERRPWVFALRGNLRQMSFAYPHRVWAQTYLKMMGVDISILTPAGWFL
jgi:hypothetical protein